MSLVSRSIEKGYNASAGQPENLCKVVVDGGGGGGSHTVGCLTISGGSFCIKCMGHLFTCVKLSIHDDAMQYLCSAYTSVLCAGGNLIHFGT